MKVLSIEGRAGFLKETEAELTSSSASFAGGFALIKQKGAASYFDGLKDSTITGGLDLPVGAPVWLDKFSNADDNPLEEGDIVQPWTQDVACWITDTPDALSEGEVDLTSQCDQINGEKDIRGDQQITETGTINGFYESTSDMQKDIRGLFTDQIIHSGTNITFKPRQKDQNFWYWLTYRKMTEVGEVELTVIRKLRISGYSAGKQSSGGVPFNFNYTTLKSWDYQKVIA